ncbi:MAG: hypothetical protein ACI88A_002565, partial [Paraglaciecola sp.]
AVHPGLAEVSIELIFTKIGRAKTLSHWVAKT